jgi:hypothetical protein
MFKRVFPRILLVCFAWYLPAAPIDSDTAFRLTSAKNVCLEGRTRNPKDTDRLASELEKWGRYRVADRPACDITIGIQAASGAQIGHAGKLRLDDDRDYLVLTVWDYQAGVMIYRDIAEWSFPGNPVRIAVRNLRSHVEAEQRAKTSANRSAQP